jgi:predicted O-methyltransferase YrrM
MPGMENKADPSTVRRWVKSKPVFRPFLAAWFGTKMANQHFLKRLPDPYRSIMSTGELSNFTYDLTEANLRYLAETVSVVTGRSPEEVEIYIREASEDQAMIGYLKEAMSPGLRRGAEHSVRMPFGRRLGWYAFVRILKPRVIVETGVDRGHGSVLLCSALMRNAKEGFDGHYYGTDINPTAGWLLGGEYQKFGQILYGDSIESLKALDCQIDLFINDSDHSADYEAEEYQTVKDKLTQGAIILGDNAHSTDRLAKFARQTERKFLFFKEVPASHWYPGGGIGIAYRR